MLGGVTWPRAPHLAMSCRREQGHASRWHAAFQRQALSQEDTYNCLGFFPPLAKLLLWAIRPHLNERLVGNEMGFVLFRDNIKQGKTEIITCCLIKILFSRAQHGAAGWHFLSSQPTFGSCFITSQKKPVRAQPRSYRAESQTASCGCSAVGLCLLLKPT